jgi:hypothetical protein
MPNQPRIAVWAIIDLLLTRLILKQKVKSEALECQRHSLYQPRIQRSENRGNKNHKLTQSANGTIGNKTLQVKNQPSNKILPHQKSKLGIIYFVL